jgi:hypothetical protein
MTMRRVNHFKLATAITGFALAIGTNALAFEGRINAVTTRGSQTDALLYTVGTNFLRVEMTATNSDKSRAGWPNPVDILDRNSGELTLLFSNNRSFVRLKPAAENSSPTPPGFPPMPAGLPPDIGPQTQPPGLPARPIGLPPDIGPTNLPGMPAMPNRPAMPSPPPGLPPGVGPQAQTPNAPGIPAMPQMPAMPMMPPPMMEKVELKATGEKTNLLGFACEKFEIKQRGETMEIWATDQMLPFQNYVRNQPHRFGPRMIEEQWGGLLTAKKLFPLRASLRFDNGSERFRFEVQSVTPQKLTDDDAKLFQPPTNYFEIQPLPF